MCEMDNCIYSEDLPENLLNVWYILQRGAQVQLTIDDCHMTLQNGARITVSADDYTFAVTPVDRSLEVRDVQIDKSPQYQYLQTGKHGPLHIDVVEKGRSRRAIKVV